MEQYCRSNDFGKITFQEGDGASIRRIGLGFAVPHYYLEVRVRKDGDDDDDDARCLFTIGLRRRDYDATAHIPGSQWWFEGLVTIQMHDYGVRRCNKDGEESWGTTGETPNRRGVLASSLGTDLFGKAEFDLTAEHAELLNYIKEILGT